LGWCIEHGASRVHICSDSLLLVQQMVGNYKVKNAGLKPLHGQARLLASRVGRVSYEHVPREMNKAADRLANLAMDEAMKKG
jgi:ribonuclease HI